MALSSAAGLAAVSLGRHQPTAFPLAHQARSFDQDINAWNVSQATDMRQFFYRASAFNQPLGAWQVGRVRNMEQMFNELGDFDQDLNAWECADRHSNLLDRLMLCLTPCLFRCQCWTSHEDVPDVRHGAKRLTPSLEFEPEPEPAPEPHF